MLQHKTFFKTSNKKKKSKWKTAKFSTEVKTEICNMYTFEQKQTIEKIEMN